MTSLTLPMPTATDGSGYRIFTTPLTSSLTGARYAPSMKDFIDIYYSLLKRWESETSILSNPDEITNHDCFQKLVHIAPVVVSYIIDSLRKNPSPLVWVLEDAFQTKPYPDSATGDFAQMAEGWITWAQRNGYELRG